MAYFLLRKFHLMCCKITEFTLKKKRTAPRTLSKVVMLKAFNAACFQADE